MRAPRFPPAVIRHAVWLYLRFTFSYHDVEDLLAERGVEASYETVRRWVLKFGLAIKVRAKHPDMVLLHGGSPCGAEPIAACWADNRKVAQVLFKPDWARHRNAAPFKRNDQMLDALPVGIIVFPGSGISANLADKARKMGIPVWRFIEGGAA
jgi:YspA, cpYpsA-related SLOG family